QGQPPAMIDKLQAHYGFTRMPFGRDLAPGMLHRHAAHNEAVARITWCITERAIGVITGEVGAGKTVSVRTVLAGLDASRHSIIYLPNPMIGVRGLHETIVTAFGGTPDRSGSRLTAQASAILAAQRDARGTTPVLVIDDPVPLIHTTARGYPRAVNTLAVQALVATYAAGKAIVDEQAARAAIGELTDPCPPAPHPRPPAPAPSKAPRHPGRGAFPHPRIGSLNAAKMGIFSVGQQQDGSEVTHRRPPSRPPRR